MYKIANKIKGMASPNPINKTLFLIMIGLLSVHAFPIVAQQHVYVYYLKNEIIPAGNKLTYIASSEIDSTEPKQFIVKHRDSTSNFSLNDSFTFKEDVSDLFLSPNPSTGLVNIQAPNEVNTVKITDKTGTLFIEKTNVNSKGFTVDISKLKNGFYILEVITTAKKHNEKKAE